MAPGWWLSTGGSEAETQGAAGLAVEDATAVKASLPVCPAAASPLWSAAGRSCPRGCAGGDLASCIVLRRAMNASEVLWGC